MVYLTEGEAEIVSKDNIQYKKGYTKFGPLFANYSKDEMKQRVIISMNHRPENWGIFRKMNSFKDTWIKGFPYDQFNSLHYYLYHEHGGYDKYKSFVAKVIDSGGNVDQSLQQIYGLSEKEVWENWKAYFNDFR